METLQARNATLADLAALLTEQEASKLDVVVPARGVRSSGGRLIIDGTGSPMPDPTAGFVEGPGTFTPTAICDEGIAEKLGVPLAYLRRMRTERPDLYDANVNGWLRGADSRNLNDRFPNPDPRSFLIRCFRGADDDSGVARAFLSDGFKRMDNLDVLTAALEAIRDAGVDAQVVGCDLSERRMQVRLAAPGIAALAPVLLAGYRSPFDRGGIRAGAAGNMLGGPGHEYAEDVVFAGLVIGNSETGGGAFHVTPRLVVRICINGLTVTRDALRSVHLGSKMEAGVVRWTADTERKNLELVAAKTRDAVTTFLDVDYVRKVIAGIEEQAGVPVADPAKTVEVIGKALGFPAERAAGILDYFVRGGQMTAGGVLNAVTAYAQAIEDPDVAEEVESAGLRALELAAAR